MTTGWPALMALATRRAGRHEFEFEMLYGVRTDWQLALRAMGYNLRVYLPFGADWWPYAIRRVGSIPATHEFGWIRGGSGRPRPTRPDLVLASMAVSQHIWHCGAGLPGDVLITDLRAIAMGRISNAWSIGAIDWHPAPPCAMHRIWLEAGDLVVIAPGDVHTGGTSETPLGYACCTWSRPGSMTTRARCWARRRRSTAR